MLRLGLVVPIDSIGAIYGIPAKPIRQGETHASRCNFRRLQGRLLDGLMVAQRGLKRMTNTVFWRAASTLLFYLLLAVAGTAAATEPPYKQALARGAYLEALPLAQAALAGAERGSPNWRGVALDLVNLHIQTGRYAPAESMLADFNAALATEPGAAATSPACRSRRGF